MAWQRKIPFGYMIRDGLTQPHPQEADAVRYIFGQYLAEASLLAIAEDMTRRGPRYHQHTAEIRPIQGKAVCGLCGAKLARGHHTHGRVYWRCRNSECGQNIAISDEVLAGLVDGRLRELAQASHLLTAPEPRCSGPDLDAIRLQNELTLALNRGGENPDYIKFLILAATAQRYSQLPDPTPAHALEQLRARLEESPADAATLSALLGTAVQAVRLNPDRTVELELVNGEIITEAKEESA